MTIHHQDEHVTVYAGDCRDILPSLPDNSVDAVVTDPPYDLTSGKRGGSGPASVNPNSPGGRSRIGTGNSGGFMGHDWDATGVAFDPDTWRHVLRVLKPGGHMVAFGGTRTWHRIAVAIEDAGFEIRDNLAWIYSQGFPKSLDVSKAIDKAAGAVREVISEGPPVKRMIPGADQNKTGSWIKDNGREYVPTETAPATDAAKQWAGWGTALKPAFEPIVLARKPFTGTVVGNVLEHNTGAIHIDACRVAHRNEADLAESQSKNRHADFGSGARDNKIYGVDERTRASQGNYDGAAGRWPPNVILDEDQAAELDKQSGSTTSALRAKNYWTDATNQIYGPLGKSPANPTNTYGDEGGASRFFPIFKYTPKANTDERPTVDGEGHSTVKPLDLMRWLVKLITPPGGIVLDPFVGSGTTAEACIHEHRRCIAIEIWPPHLPLIMARLNKPMAIGFDFEGTE